MVLAVEQMHLEVDDREADQRPGLRGLAEALSTDGNIFLGDVAALDLVEELEARAALGRDDVDLDFAELADPPDCFLWV